MSLIRGFSLVRKHQRVNPAALTSPLQNFSFHLCSPGCGCRSSNQFRSNDHSKISSRTILHYVKKPDFSKTKFQIPFIYKHFGLETNIASPTWRNRWAMCIPAVMCHISIGSPYAWSLMTEALTRDIGVVAPTTSDWTLAEAALPLSIVFFMQGVSAAIASKWQVRVGGRMSILLASGCFGGGLLIGAAGIHYHSLALLYTGYGFLGGTGIGLGYTPPVSSLMKWLPDQKGLASGIIISGFGGGALCFTPFMQFLLATFYKIPTYLGPRGDFELDNIEGKLYIDINGKVVEVVEATAKDIASLPYNLSEGLYIVGSGNSGAAEALAVAACTYGALMLGSAYLTVDPHPDVAANLPKPPGKEQIIRDVTMEEAIRTPQFHYMGCIFLMLAMGGMGLFAVGKPMMGEVFSLILPDVVNGEFASKFLLVMFSANIVGRLGWSVFSDIIGTRAMFTIFTAGSIPMYLALPYMVHQVVETGSTLPLYGFIGCTAIALSFMGGVFAVLPAYEADYFGGKHVGPIHNRIFLYNSLAAFAGPSLLLKLRSYSEVLAVEQLLQTVDPSLFQHVYGHKMDFAYELLESKVLTISNLLPLCPPGTPDPTPHLYDLTMYVMAGLMGVATVANALIRPLPVKVVDAVAEKVAEKLLDGPTPSVISGPYPRLRRISGPDRSG